MTVEIWSDVVCPWCYVGKRRFEQALAGFPGADAVDVVFRSFELDPGAPAEVTGDYAERLAAKYGTTLDKARGMLATMTDAGAEDGLDLRFDLARGGSTFDAHRLLHLAAEQGLQAELKERLMRATFTEGAPIGHRPTLVALAAEVGLDAAEAEQVLASGRYADEVRSDEAQARAYGITGVPFFVVDAKFGVSGAQPADVLRQVLDQAWGDRPVPLVPVGGAGPGCEGDSCAV
jgi:predicted DsbA family dithiol-disulfide isomerase